MIITINMTGINPQKINDKPYNNPILDCFNTPNVFKAD